MAEQTNYEASQLPSGKVIQGNVRVDKEKFSKRVVRFLFSDDGKTFTIVVSGHWITRSGSIPISPR